MPDKLKYGPWAVVAGSSEGIGLAFVREIAGAGINVVMVARRPDALAASAEQVADEFGVEVRTVQAELASPDIVEKLREATDDIDVGLLVFNAAAANFKPFLDQNETEFLAAINLSCIAQTRLVQHFGRRMRERAHGGLLLVSSFAGSAGIARMACYSGAKGFTDKFGEALWAELKPQGIDVFVMVVGSTNTERRRQSGSKDQPGMPVAEPEDVAAYALASLGGEAPIGALPIYEGVWKRVYDTDRVAAVTGDQTQIPDSDKIF
jgi:short-subunit dehydrogenase